MRIQPSWLLGVFIFSICATIWIPFAITVGGLNVRASQFLLPLLCLLVLLPRPRTSVSVWSLLAVAGGAIWWLSLALWTLVQGPDLGHPLGRVLLMGINLLHAVVAYILVVRAGDVRIAARALLVSVSALNGLQLVLSIAPALGVSLPQAWLTAEAAPMLVGGEVVDGTVLRFVSGVAAGCVSAATAVLATCLWLDPRWRSKWLLVIAGVTSVVGIVVGFSRQSVLSLVVGLLVAAPFLIGAGRILRVLKLAGLSLLLLVFAVSLVLLTPGGRQYWQAFAGRTAQIADPGAYATGTAADRMEIWLNMAGDVARNPLVGSGQDSYLRYMGPDEAGAHNFPMEVLHSSGLLGFAGYLLLHGIAPLVALGVLVGRRLPEHASVPVVAILGAYVSMVAASLTNVLYWNPTYWLMLALMIAAVRLAGRSRPEPGSAAPQFGGPATIVSPASQIPLL